MQKGLSKFEETLVQQSEEKRLRREAQNFTYTQCGKDCHSRNGLAGQTRRYIGLIISGSVGDQCGAGDHLVIFGVGIIDNLGAAQVHEVWFNFYGQFVVITRCDLLVRLAMNTGK